MGLGAAIWGNGLKMGIDFAGGVIVQVQFAQPVSDEALKTSLDVPALPGITTQRYGEGGRDYLLRFSKAENADATQLRTTVTGTLAAAFPGNPAEIVRLEIVGPKVGADLTNKALSALYYSILLIAVYISGRFEQRWMAGAAMAGALWGGMYVVGLTGLSMGWLVLLSLGITMGVCLALRLNFALGAVVGLLHDVLITVGLLALMGVEIDLNVMAALLTLVGYSHCLVIPSLSTTACERISPRRRPHMNAGSSDQPQRQPDPFTHHPHQRHHLSGHAFPVPAGRRRHPRLCPDYAHRRGGGRLRPSTYPPPCCWPWATRPSTSTWSRKRDNTSAPVNTAWCSL